MSNLTNWLPNYKQVYGDFTDPHPTEDTLQSDLKFVAKESREGQAFNVPVVVSLEQGITPDVSGDAFALRPSRGSVIKNAQVNGATLLMTGDIPYDAMLRSKNGTGNGRQGNAFKDAFELKSVGLMEQMEHFVEASLLYGCGTSAAIGADIGVVQATVVGASLNAGQTCPITIQSWAPGFWARMTNGLVDVYAANGTTVIETQVVVTAVNPDYDPAGSPVAPNLLLTKSGSAAVVAVGHRIVPSGWAQTSCVGLETQLKNTGTLFGIPANTYSVWKPVRYSNASGTLSRLKILALMARMFPNGTRNGGNLYVSPPVFADLAEEADTLQRFVSEEEVKIQGANKLLYKSPAGVVTVKLHAMMKYGQAMFIPKGAAERVGSSPTTFRGEGDEWFFLELPSNAGSQIRAISNQSPFVRMPNRCAFISNITPTSLA